MRVHLELLHQISVLNSWATAREETISRLSNKQATEALKQLRELWKVLDRRVSK